MRISVYINLSIKGPTKSPLQIKIILEAKQIALQSTYLILEVALEWFLSLCDITYAVL